ncbi:hypothetical protein ATCC90586_011595 [Pythium insidiosum]|nr:hypothetical protein ATCC90586_011595 [Pythium insidiosum]
MKEGAALARHEVERIKEDHRELVQKLSEVRAEHSASEKLLEGRIATLKQELDTFKALGATPEQIAAREQRLQAVVTYAILVAQVFERACREYEAVLGPLVLGAVSLEQWLLSFQT